ncbi:BamA/TamA family outer membrane protein [Algoriphagus namhaensis]|uniref:BamA/TamA family outer membrane protein n=1 Tax=Algoriphagus namhaensis TaxID=915353 RepID=A0ABV8AVE2_9BACT
MKFSKYILFIGGLMAMTACSLTKNLPDGEFVLYENELLGTELSDKEGLAELYRQEPNTRIPLINRSLGVSIYRLGKSFYDSAKVVEKLERTKEEKSLLIAELDSLGNTKKLVKKAEKKDAKIEHLEEKAEYGNLLMRTGNPVTILDSALVSETVTQQQNYLINNGFFDADVDFEVTTKKQKAYVSFLINEKEPYLVDSFYTKSENQDILRLLNKTKKESFLDTGKIYTQSDVIAERERIEKLLKNNGYYTFSKSYIEYNVFMDTLTKRLNVEQLILKPTFAEKHNAYTIDSITFTIVPPSEDFVDEKVQREFENIDFSFYKERYSERIFASRIFFREGDLYSRDDFIESQKQLNNLDLFRFLNISFDTLGTSLTAKIFSQPNQKYQLTNQLGLSITEQLPGPFFSTSLRNRNFFRAGEILEFNFRAGLEGVASATDQGVYQSRELGTSVSVIFPRFLLPFYRTSLQKFGRYNPNTRAQFGYNYTNRPEYTRTSFNGLLAYTWATRNNRQQFTINAADINYVRTPSILPEFVEILEDLQAEGNNLIWSFLPSFVSAVSAQSIINFNEYGNFKQRNASLLRLFVESGGTSLNFFDVPSNEEDIEFANFQWLKFQADFRRYYPLDKKQTLAYRANFGIAQPYGISGGILPYEKYFFAGGGTSVRAWQARRLGPGSYSPTVGENGPYDYRIEQPAEMIFESMFEYRRKLYGYFDIALFIDVGNSWVIGVDNARPGADFRWNRFYKELAVGTGIGLRMDFDFLVVRLDLATKAIDPAQPEGNRWVLDNISFRKPFGVRGQTVLNFGIGYPF